MEGNKMEIRATSKRGYTCEFIKKEPRINKFLDKFKKDPIEIVELDGKKIGVIKLIGIAHLGPAFIPHWRFFPRTEDGINEEAIAMIHHRLVCLNSGDE